jgi:SAM-dependent methyltransferase
VDARRLEPEWLDELPAEDPRARRSRSDLRRVNAIMGNARIVAGALAAAPRSVVDLGAGDGAFALRLARALSRPPVQVTLVDRQHIVSPRTLRAFESMGTRVEIAQHDVFEWLERAPTISDAIVANLFLHHFEDEPLARLLSLAARRTSTFVACEPRRSSLALAGARLLGAIGCNDVTRHDAAVSVRAGFRDAELSRLWPAGAWTLREERRGGFSHLFAAQRRAA